MSGLRFGHFDYDPAMGLRGRLGETKPLGSRARRLLEILLSRRGAIVSKTDLIDAAWPGQAVEDSNLSVQIAQLRKLIGAEWIRTVERVGYQFMPDAGITSPAFSLPVLSVPAFSPGDETARSAHTELLAVLSGFHQFIAATEIANARYTLRGSVRQEKGRIRFALHLVDVASGQVLWGGVSDAAPGEIGPLLERLASTVEAEVAHAEIERPDREGMRDDSPYQLYLRAKRLGRSGRSDDNGAAIGLLGAALAAEPENPAFLAAICEALAGQRIALGFGPLTEDDQALAYSYGLRGLELDHADAGERALFGLAIFRGADPDLGHWIAREAAASNPNSTMALVTAANVTRNWSDPEQARAFLHRVIALNPADPLLRNTYGALAGIESAAGRFEDALVWARRSYAVNPNYAAAHWHIAAANAKLGRLDVARGHVERLRTVHPSTTLERIEAGQPTRNGHTRNTLEGLAHAGLS